MKRERPEYIWDAVRPFLIYNILFIAIRTVLSGILEYILLDPAQETVSVSLLWSEISQIAIIGITSVCAAIPLMGVGQRSIMIMRGRSEQAWITNRRDSRLLLSILPLGTLSLSVLLNLLLSESGASSEVPVSAAAIPAAAAVYGLLTPYRRTRIQRNCVVQAEKGLYTIAGGALVLTSVRRRSRADPSRVLRVYNGNSICLKL